MKPEDPQEEWSGDVLRRRKIAGFYSEHLRVQSLNRSEEKLPGLTVALDADWGAGKTFFINRWAQDLRTAGHPVVQFDAWTNDIGDEASFALMASIATEIGSWQKKLPASKNAISQTKSALAAAMKGIRRAVLPTSKVVAQGLMKKALGFGVEELIEVANGQNSAGNGDLDSRVLDSGLDKFFEKAIESHKDRQNAISEFRAQMEKTIDLLKEHAKAKLPMFVFIDELDRCRPTYALKLLEEIKHVFGTPHICFVVATNINQLAEATKAVYGSGFEASRYLRRFFDSTIALPEPDAVSFARLLIESNKTLEGRNLDSGLSGTQLGGELGCLHAFSLVSTAFSLDLRSQKQVFDKATTAASTIPRDRTIFALWLFALCAIQHSRPLVFEKLVRKEVKISVALESVAMKDQDIRFNVTTDDFRGTTQERRSTLSAVLNAYYEWSRKSTSELSRTWNSSRNSEYPVSNLHALVEDAQKFERSNRASMSAISDYVRLVYYSGMQST